jgi:hypothetical protein
MEMQKFIIKMVLYSSIFYIIIRGIYKNGLKIKGNFKFLNGFEYIGNCLGNKFKGKGQLIFPSGKKIKGLWN